ncbi:MAG: hypothetical protein A2Y88_02790 [Chloroflexi bacterium RBG_13_48_10]|nr:MAG: hypothetical protein A2Y88_02790 [Chloroflexi bacterium RBG_13_48_10]
MDSKAPFARHGYLPPSSPLVRGNLIEIMRKKETGEDCPMLSDRFIFSLLANEFFAVQYYNGRDIARLHLHAVSRFEFLRSNPCVL